MTNDLRSALGLHAEALILQERRGAVIAANLANAATPGYKARDIDFDAALARHAGTSPLAVTDPRHVADIATAGKALYRVPVTASLDGNTVEPAVEQVAFAEATLRQQASLSLLNRRISGLMSAIKGE
jgi:flagellar basal-body rod protein FlgB